jgi:hypothetical protein
VDFAERIDEGTQSQIGVDLGDGDNSLTHAGSMHRRG